MKYRFAAGNLNMGKEKPPTRKRSDYWYNILSKGYFYELRFWITGMY